MYKRLPKYRSLHLARVRACLAALCLFSMVGLAADRGLPAQDGIDNFGKVNESLYRGAQPDEAAIQSLKRLGVKTIINLRKANDGWKQEAAVAQANGITYTNIPLKGTGRPADEQVARVLALLKDSAGAVFVHCQHGCDRTGMIIACYRIQHDGWSTETALAEARHFGMSRLERGMRAYIVDFGKKAKPGDSRPKPTTATFPQ